MALRGTLTHRKTRRLARELDVPIPFALGVMEALWHVTASHTPTGAIGALSNQDIADEMFWELDADALIDALIDAGLIDRDPAFRLVVHGWAERADQSVKRKVERSGLKMASGDEPRLAMTSHDQSHARALPEPEPEPEPGPEKPPTPFVPSETVRVGSVRVQVFEPPTPPVKTASPQEVQGLINAAVEDYAGRVPSRRWTEEVRAEYERALKLGMRAEELAAALVRAVQKGKASWAAKDADRHGLTPRYLTNFKDALADEIARWKQRRERDERDQQRAAVAPQASAAEPVDNGWFLRKVDAGPYSEEWRQEPSLTMREMLRKTFARRHPEEWETYRQQQTALEQSQAAQLSGALA